MLMLTGHATQMLAEEQLNRSSIDPARLLAVHQRSREQGCRIISVIVGAASTARAVWGGWLAGAYACPEPWMPTLVAPGVDVADVQTAIAFGSRDLGAGAPALPVLFVPGRGEFEQAVRSARELLTAEGARPVALVVDPSTLMGFLKEQGSGAASVRSLVLGGLVVLDQHVEAVLNRTLLTSTERPLYASSHASTLADLLNREPARDRRFEVGRRIRGRSGVSHHVDLYCGVGQMGIQVFDAQGLSNEKQSARDRLIQEDLMAAGLTVLSFNACDILADPRWVLGRAMAAIERNGVSA